MQFNLAEIHQKSDKIKKKIWSFESGATSYFIQNLWQKNVDSEKAVRGNSALSNSIIF